MLTRLLCVLICRLAQPKTYRERKWLDKISEKCGECPSFLDMALAQWNQILDGLRNFKHIQFSQIFFKL